MMTNQITDPMTPISDLWKYDLRRGNTDHPANGACLFDAGMWLVYGRIGDNPPCSCPIIRAYAIFLNDTMPDTERQRLKPFILRVVGNRDPDAEEARLHTIVLETARQILPLVLNQWPEHQTALRALPNDASFEQIRQSAISVCEEASIAVAAWAVAWAAAWGAAAANGAAIAAARAAIDATSIAAGAASYRPSVVWNRAIMILDQALRIGKQSPEFDEAEVRESVHRFELARGGY